MQKESEVEAEQIEEGTVEKGQDHDPGEKVNRVQLKVSVKNTNKVTIQIFT